MGEANADTELQSMVNRILTQEKMRTCGSSKKETARPVIGHRAVSYRINSVARQISATKQTNKKQVLTPLPKRKTKTVWAAVTEQTSGQSIDFSQGLALSFIL